jgi:hypothetical protein
MLFNSDYNSLPEKRSFRGVFYALYFYLFNTRQLETIQLQNINLEI